MSTKRARALNAPAAAAADAEVTAAVEASDASPAGKLTP
jgi:hypothetical protein